VDSFCTHALVKFVEEESTGVVPLQCVIGANFKAGERATVLWNKRKEYPAIFLLQVSCEVTSYSIQKYVGAPHKLPV